MCRGIVKPNTACARRSFTLVEMLLALTIGTLVAGTSATVAVQTLRMQKETDTAFDRQWSRYETGGIFAADVTRLLTPAQERAATLSFPSDPDILVQMITLAPVSAIGSSFQQLLPARITYRVVQPAHTTEGVRLVRETDVLIESDPTPLTMTLANGLKRAAVETMRESTWTAPDRSARSQASKPRAIRLVCEFADPGLATLVRPVLLQRGGPQP